MHTIFLRLSLIAAGLAGSSSIGRAAEAPPEPIGYITQNLLPGDISSPRLTVFSPTLVSDVVWEGQLASVSSNVTGPSTLAVAGNPWVQDQFNGANGAFYVEVIPPGGAGQFSNIVQTVAGVSPGSSSLVTERNLDGIAQSGDLIRIRRHATLGSIFGVTNAVGLTASDDPATADEVIIRSGGNATAYFYYTGSPGYPAGWYDSAFSLAPGAAATQVIAPGDPVIVKRISGGALAIRLSGVAKSGSSALPVAEGKTLLGTVSAGAFTLGNSGLHTGDPASGVAESDDPSTADEVTLYTASGTQTYFYFSGYPGYPAGWYDSSFLLGPGEAEQIAIPPGAALAISRKGRPGFLWAVPAPSRF